MSKTVRFEDRLFAMDVFAEAPMVGGDTKGDTARISVNLSGNLKPVMVEDLDEWDVTDVVKAVIVQGEDPTRADRWPSRSEMTFFVICDLVRCKVPDDVVASIFLDPSLPVSGHVLDQGNPESYIVRQLQRAHENAFDPNLLMMNDRHFFTIVGGKARVGTIEEDEITFMEKTTLDQRYANKKVQIGTDKDGNPIYMPLAKWWFEHEQRRQYTSGVCFEPEDNSNSNKLNLWRGFTVAPRPGNGHKDWMQHVKDVICAGDEDHFDYLIKWCARLFQHPASQSEVAVVLRGREGTGKNTFVNGLAILLGRHFFESANSSEFLGQFTSHLDYRGACEN